MIASICYTRADLLAPLGLQPAEFRVGDALMGTYVPSEPRWSDVRPGVYVADVQAQVISAAAAGLAAAATINGVSWESNCSTGATHRSRQPVPVLGGILLSFRPSSAPRARSRSAARIMTTRPDRCAGSRSNRRGGEVDPK